MCPLIRYDFIFWVLVRYSTSNVVFFLSSGSSANLTIAAILKIYSRFIWSLISSSLFSRYWFRVSTVEFYVSRVAFDPSLSAPAVSLSSTDKKESLPFCRRVPTYIIVSDPYYSLSFLQRWSSAVKPKASLRIESFRCGILCDSLTRLNCFCM